MNWPTQRLTDYIDPNRIEAYLLAHKWTANRRTEKFSIWSPPHKAAPVLFVPLAPEPVDYEERLWDVVVQLAKAERRPEDVILTNLHYASADLVRIRLVSPRVGPGELPIDDGRHLFDGARDMMLAAACAAAVPGRATYGPRMPSAATEYLDGVRLGQTEPGSYVITVISAFPVGEQQPLIADEALHLDVPFARRVTTKLIEALVSAYEAADEVLTQYASVSDAFEKYVDRGVSANLCDAVSTMGAEQLAATVDVTLDWAASRPPVEAAPRAVTFKSSALPVLREAVSVLRELGPFEDQVVEGFVSRLIRAKEDEVGTIVIEGTTRGESRNVHVELPDEQYHLAVHAHDERDPVRIRGTLSKRGRSWVLSSPGQLRLESSQPEN